MEGSWRGVLAVLVILAGLTASGSSYQIIEGPQNVTVLKGSEARFNCTVTHGWKLIMWALKDVVELSITSQETIITNDRFTSASYNGSNSFISELIIHDVQPSDEGSVRCSLQNSDVFGTAFLSVQVMGTLNISSNSLIVTEGEPCNVTCYALGWTPLPDISWELEVPVSHSSYYSLLDPGDFMRALSVLTLTPLGNGTLTCVAELMNLQASKSLTVNLTVVQPPPDNIGEEGTSLPTWAIVLLAVAFSLLLILIIALIIVFCCCGISRREKEASSYQNEIRRTANVKTNNADPETRLKSGKENFGYSSDEARAAQIASLPPKSGEVSLPEQRSHTSPYKEPKMRQPSPAGHPRVSSDTASPQKVRNVTLV
ncbi:immunoglobulin superfamily member 5 isoform X1 [Peromyscus leucopus]|uniref:immunoglobulin superfamily member 5 isoform X1 n=1 Tax=Peromyscus leucopus TaxID=10041 RepID=UPI0010A143E3|nr:immunoglobulin superfamily member 5 isoform X1 [Peromyscus leucopus]XP_037065503.1 immunoglobulin superfamily member 5 isoform X1 [Peromyscus leucopus]